MPASLADSECDSAEVSLASIFGDNVRPFINRPIPIVAPKLSFFSPGPKVRNPVIYLYPPSHLPDVIVELLLTSSWSFPAVYPSPQATIPSDENPIAAQSLSWAIEAEPDGRLVEKTIGVEATNLYWEAT